MKSFKLIYSSLSFHLWFLIVLALCTYCSCNKNSSRQLCIESEKMALLQFKNDLIDGGNRLSSWADEEGDCCKWTGIVCDDFTGHVEEIRLRGPDDGLHGHCHGSFETDADLEEAAKQMLAGTLNPSIVNLKQLKYLDLSCNDFGLIQIPSFIGSLKNLRYLNLSKSQFYGEIPHQLGNLSMLHFLDLQTNPLSSTLSVKNLKWLSNLPLLEHVNLGNIDLSRAADWLQVINTLPSLFELHLPSCALSQIPLRLARVNFTSLTVLDLSYNIFDNLLPGWIFSLSKLVSLDLTSCLFHGLIPGTDAGLHNMTSLRILHVSGNDFMNSSLVLKGLSSLSRLVSLDISTCSLSTPVLRNLQNLSSLVSLDLANNQIKETIPKTLVNLCNLTNLDLQSNRFDGSVSELLQNFCECESPKLESLAFRGNYLSGQLPDKLGRLKNLVTFDVGFNSLNGTIPESIGRLLNLVTLILNENSLSGSIPDSIGSLSSLDFLDLSYNKLSGSLPESLGQLGKLSFLSIYHNSLTGLVGEDQFANLTALKKLRAEDNQLTFQPRINNWIPPFQLEVLRIGSWNLGPRFPSWVQLQRNLTELDIANANISDTVPNWFWSKFSGVIFLNISHNRIQGKLPGDLSILAPQAVVDLSANGFYGPLPGRFNRPDLRLLDLSYNNLSGSLDQFLCSGIQEVKELEVLNLANNNLSGTVPNCWKNWESLAVLNFENNNLSGEVPPSVASISSLLSLDMRNNKLSGNFPVSLLNSESLIIIELAQNELTGSIPRSIGRDVSSLKLLSLRSNKLEGQIPDELCLLTSIQILDLAHNSLSGNLPTCFDNLGVMSGTRSPSPIILFDDLFQNQVLGSASLVTKGRVSSYSSILYLVTTLDLSRNKFSGPIPNELVALQGLRYLNLSENQLSGRIPQMIGEMKLLESLDLSVNHLDGNIPLSMSSLTSLSLLNLSYNNLTGKIPTSTQLQSFNETSFIGNSLCGAPLIQCGVPNDDGKGNEESSGKSSDFDWILVICTIVGFVIGFWVVVCPLMASRLWRNAYYNFLDGMWCKLCDSACKCYRKLCFRKLFSETRSSTDPVQQFEVSQYIY